MIIIYLSIVSGLNCANQPKNQDSLYPFCNKKSQTQGFQVFGYVERIFTIVYRMEVYLLSVLCYNNLIDKNLRGNEMEAVFGESSCIDSWMQLVRKVSWNFPGLETEECIYEHEQTVLKFMNKKQALCVKSRGAIIGVLLFSHKKNMICCMAVDPEHRKQGIASILLRKALNELDRSREITVSTFRENDEKGIAPRALYKKFGFQEGELTEEFGYPNQVFVLHP